jgi:hypothetical protein
MVMLTNEQLTGIGQGSHPRGVEPATVDES